MANWTPAGEFRHRVTIEAPPITRGSRGQRTGDWTTVASASAAINELRGDESEKANQLVATATHRIKIRGRRKFQLETKHRFKFRGRYFNIGHILDVDQLGVEYVCLCTETKP